MTGKKILVVDNEQDQRDMMKRLLTMMGFKVEGAESPEQALNLVRKEEFHLIITDLIMPGMDGIELCEKIREIRPTCLICSFTGYLDLYEPEKLKRVGFNGHIEKPISVKELEDKIKSIL